MFQAHRRKCFNLTKSRESVRDTEECGTTVLVAFNLHGTCHSSVARVLQVRAYFQTLDLDITESTALQMGKHKEHPS